MRWAAIMDILEKLEEPAEEVGLVRRDICEEPQKRRFEGKGPEGEGAVGQLSKARAVTGPTLHCVVGFVFGWVGLGLGVIGGLSIVLTSET